MVEEKLNLVSKIVNEKILFFKLIIMKMWAKWSLDCSE